MRTDFFARALLLAILLFPSAASAEARPEIALIEWQEDGLAENGFRDGIQQVWPDARFYVYNASGDRNLLEILIAQSRERRPDLFYVAGTPAALALLDKVEDIPVVFTMVQAPVDDGIIAAWSSSENNATGISNRVPVLNQLKTLKRLIRFGTLGVFFDPDNPDARSQVSELSRLQPFLGFRLKKFPLRSPSDLSALDLTGENAVDAVYFPVDPLIHRLGRSLSELVSRAKLPSLAADMAMVTRHGALLGLVPDNYQIGRLAAFNALAILEGTPPEAIPSRSLDHFMVALNMRTARKIDIQVPFSLLVMADTIVR